MRTQNQLAIKRDCHESISALMAKYKLGEPGKVVTDETGWVNPCFFVDNRLVFRFNARDQTLPKFQREKLVFDRLASANADVDRLPDGGASFSHAECN